jgi:5-formaminoimidazole-4-carboxamide-1-(beta)-D-ribofuranosyl 5'-monophosphate synthetase
MVTIGMIGSHSAEEIAVSAKTHGFKTLVFCQKGREKFYQHYNRHLYDHILVLNNFKDIINEENQQKLLDLDTIIVPNRSLSVYVGYDALENDLKIPMYGNRSLLRIEDRNFEKNQYWLMKETGMRLPRQYSHENIPGLAIVKVQQKNKPLERAFFYVTSPDDLQQQADHLIKADIIDEEEFKHCIIEEFVLGARFNANFQAYALSSFDRFDFVGFDDRIQTNIGGILNLPAREQLKINIPIKNEEVGHKGVTMRESKKILVYNAAEQFLDAVEKYFPPKMIGLFALQGALNEQSEFVIFDISPRVPGGPILGPTSPEMRRLTLKYPNFSSIESPLDLCMMEIIKAIQKRPNGGNYYLIVIIDFGSQLTHLIAKKIRQLGEYSEIHSIDIQPDELKRIKPVGIILSGGPDSVYETTAPTINAEILDLGIPILGICYGMQLIAYKKDGVVELGTESEYGVTKIIIEDLNHLLVRGLSSTEEVLMSHRDRVTQAPSNGVFLAQSSTAKAIFADDKNKFYGLQFHPEVVHTPNGMVILDNFLTICNASRDWSSSHFIEEKIQELKKISKPVLMAVSGGVDSTVGATIIEHAIPELLHCVFVDNGLLRENESEEIKKLYSKMFKYFHFVDAQDLFFERLKGVKDPENKRKIIGNTFIEVFEQKAKELETNHGKFGYLGQGTIYPDRVESAATSSQASVIKTHHNVGGLPEKMNLKLLEPLNDLYKYEVREVWKNIGN